MAHKDIEAIIKAKRILVMVYGPDDVFYFKVTKKEALRALNPDAIHQLEVYLCEDDDVAIIGGRIGE